jgi:hypothetical protein
VEVHAVGHGQSLLACLLASAAQGAQSAQVIDTQNANIVLADELAYKFVSLCSTTQILAFIKVSSIVITIIISVSLFVSSICRQK